MSNKSTYISRYLSPVGTLEIAASDTLLKYITFLNQGDNISFLRENDITLLACRELDEYFHGQRREFDLPLRIYDTQFRTLIWNTVMTVPYGETRTYNQIAELAGKPNSARAVGTALKKNPYLIVIPCHRIIPADGGTGEYVAGADVKKYLIDMENNTTVYDDLPNSMT